MFYTVFAQRKKKLLQESLYLCANKLYRTWKTSISNWWCFFPSHSDVSSRDLMLEGQSAPVVKWLTLALKQTLLAYPFLIFFRDYHHTEISSCEACAHGLWNKNQKNLSRCLLVRCSEHAKLSKIIAVS